MTSATRKLKQPFNIVPPTMFDTHKYIKFLKSKGIKEPQAESIVQLVSESREFDMAKVATKEQVDHLEKRLERLEQGQRWVLGLIVAILTLIITMLFKH